MAPHLLQRIENPLNAVLLHGEKKAATELLPGGPRIEQRRRSMREEPCAHHVVRLQHPLLVPPPHRNRNPHDEVLRPLDNPPVDVHQVRPRQSLEPKVVVTKVPGVVNSPLPNVHAPPSVPEVPLGNERARPTSLGVNVPSAELNALRKGPGGHLVHVAHRDSSGEDGEVRVGSGVVGAGLGGEVVELAPRQVEEGGRTEDILLSSSSEHLVHQAPGTALAMPAKARVWVLRALMKRWEGRLWMRAVVV